MGSTAPRLIVDLQTVQGGFFGNRGIRRYALGLARSLRHRGAVHALLLNPGRRWHEELPADLVGADELTWSTTPELRDLDAAGATAYVMTSPFERTRPVQSAIPPYVVESGLPLVTVLYDLIPEIVDVYPPDLMALYWARRPLVAQADLVLTLSEHVRRDAIERLEVDPARVAVIGAGASDFFRPPRRGEDPAELLARHVPRLTRPYVLSVTGWSAHKNAEGLVSAWSRLPRGLRRSHQLVLACILPPDAKSAWLDQARSAGLETDEVVVTDFVDDDVLRALYQQAALFVLPSRQEGFGLPVVEAVRCGCPAITSSATALPEVLDFPPATFPVDDTDATASLIERALTDDGFRAELRAAGAAAAERHRWERVGERAARACAALDPRRPRVVPPLRVALVGRFTTTAATHAADRLADALGGRCHIDRFAVRAPGDPHASGCYPARALGHAFDPWGYDAVVYAVDRGPSRELVDLATQYPGVIWFVDGVSDPEVMAEVARHARGAVVGAELGRLSVGAGAFGRPVPTSVVHSGDDVAEVGALVERLSRSS